MARYMKSQRPKKGTEQWFEAWFAKWPSTYHLYEELADTWKYPIKKAGPGEPKPDWPKRDEPVLYTRPCPKHDRNSAKRAIRPLPGRLDVTRANHSRKVGVVPILGPIDNGRVPHRFCHSGDREAKVVAAKKIKDTLRFKRGKQESLLKVWLDKGKKRERTETKDTVASFSSKRTKTSHNTSPTNRLTPSSELVSSPINMGDTYFINKPLIRISYYSSPKEEAGLSGENKSMVSQVPRSLKDDLTSFMPYKATVQSPPGDARVSGLRIRISARDAQGQRRVIRD
ncbi:hypothetical protein FRC02_005010 [Tulasnella sp. 418]|nr:hypothetical protein FRC02_005010 [Tulasnella sp. 418]